MQLSQIMEIVHAAYPDEYTREYWNAEEERVDEAGSGDTLAEFVVREVAETFDASASDAAQLCEAARVLRRAENDLRGLGDALDAAIEALPK